MKKYIFFPTDREIWADIAIKLYNDKIAKPIIWHGHNINNKKIKSNIKECKVLDFFKINKGNTPNFFLNSNSKFFYFIEDKNFYKIKDQTIKMMDRQDFCGAYRYIDRDSIFFSILQYSFYLIESQNPDFLLMLDTPHFPSHFIIFKICEYLEIKTYTLVSITNNPLLFLRKGINGDFINIQNIKSITKSKDIDSIINEKLNLYFKLFNNNGQSEPIYMKKQKEIDKINLKNLLKKINFAYKAINNNLDRYYGKSAYQDKISIIQYLLFHLIIKHKIIKKNKESLKFHTTKYSIPKNKIFIYFPIHYEPERTSNPDGGDYYNQIEALIELRKFIPKNIPIYVKEHYSQFTSSLQGYRGKSRFFYQTIRQIPNLFILDININGKDIIKKATLTITLSGTSSLEAILLGKKAMIMGNSWFENIKGIIKYNKNLNFQDIINTKLASNKEIKKSYNTIINNYSTYGTISSILEKEYNEFYKNNFHFYEFENLYNLLKYISNI